MEPTPLRFTTSDVVIAADRRGDPRDPPVFFLHGGGQTRHSWGTAAEVVAERGWCTYTLDSRGHGESDWSAEANYSLQDFALDLISIADAVGSNPVIVGASLGGLTSLLAMGRERPGLMTLQRLVDRLDTRGQVIASSDHLVIVEQIDMDASVPVIPGVVKYPRPSGEHTGALCRVVGQRGGR